MRIRHTNDRHTTHTQMQTLHIQPKGETMRIIERTTEDLQQETIELFNEIKPLLDQGESYHSAIKKIKKLTSPNSKLGWYQRLIQYGETQGYPYKEYKRKKNYTCHWRHLL